MDFTLLSLIGIPALSTIFFVLCLSLASTAHSDLREAKFYKLKGKGLVGNLTERHLTPDSMDCSFLCVNALNKNCFSFNFGGNKHRGLYECELNNSEMKLVPDSLQDREGFDYYGMTEEVS